MDPGEPRDPRGEGGRRPRDDDEDFRFQDPAMDDTDPGRTRAETYPDDARFASTTRRADEYDEPDQYEAPVFTEEELEGLDRSGGPRRFLPLEDEPTTLVARYLFPTERYRGEWKRHWIHLATSLAIGAGATVLLGYLAGYLARVDNNGLVAAAVVIWLGIIGWVAWRVVDW